VEGWRVCVCVCVCVCPGVKARGKGGWKEGCLGGPASAAVQAGSGLMAGVNFHVGVAGIKLTVA
jgi:hypothetical protein